MNKWTYAIQNSETKAKIPIKLGFETVLDANKKPVRTGKKFTIESVVAALKPNEIFIRMNARTKKTQKFIGNAVARQWTNL